MYSAVRSLRFQESKAELPVVIGRTIQNENYVFDWRRCPTCSWLVLRVRVSRSA